MSNRNRIQVGIHIPFLSSQNIVNGCPTKGDVVFIDEIIQTLVQLGYRDNIIIFAYLGYVEYLTNRYDGVRVLPIGPVWYRWLEKIANRSFTSIDRILHLSSKTINRETIDVLWVPYAASSFGKMNMPVCYTIHDLIDFHNRGNEGPMIAISKDANQIVTISNYVKHDIVCNLNIDANNVKVVPNPICLHKCAESAVDIKNNYILDVNGYREHKNTLSLLKAYELIKDDVDLNLVLCGSDIEPRYFNEIQEYIEKNGLEERVIVFTGLSFEQLEYLYNHTSLFVNPSLQEGFGRTPVEAAMHRIPVITTKGSSLYEVTKGKLVYINDP